MAVEEEEEDVFCECRVGFYFDPVTYTCRPTIAAAAYHPLISPYQAARGGGGGGGAQNPWRRMRTGVTWAKGVFVTASKSDDEDAILRRSDHQENEDSPLLPGWGAEALPRVGKSRGLFRRRRRKRPPYSPRFNRDRLTSEAVRD